MNRSIVQLSLHRKFSYLWLKYVTGTDLEQHCAKCLLGKYSNRVSPEKQVYSSEIQLNESSAKYLYLCGVSHPYEWDENFHLAWRVKEGSEIQFEEKGISGIIKNAERIPILPAPAGSHKRQTRKEFATCRNWQFGVWLKAELSKPPKIGPRMGEEACPF